MKEKKLPEEIIYSLNNHPEEWTCDTYHLSHKSGIRIWIANMGWSYILIGMREPYIEAVEGRLEFGFWDTVKLHYACKRIINNIKRGVRSRNYKQVEQDWESYIPKEN